MRRTVSILILFLIASLPAVGKEVSSARLPSQLWHKRLLLRWTSP